MKMSSTILAIDAGSSRAKAALVDRSGNLVASGAAGYAEETPACGAKEREPEAWWDGATAAVRSLPATARSAGVEAVVACGATLAMVLLDAKGCPIRPAILWEDPRGQEEAEHLRGTIAFADYSAATGASFPVSCVWPVPRLLWLERHEPRSLARLAHVLQPKDYVNYKLTGCIASDPGSQRGLANLLTRRFEWHALARLGISRRWETRLVEPGDTVGRVTPEAASSWGIRDGTPVLAGTHDFTAAFLGLGSLKEGECGHVTGTSDHLGRVVPMPAGGVPDCSPLSLAPLAPGAALLYGVISSGGGALDWACRMLGVSPTALEAALPRDLASRHRAPLFAPYLQGERTPLWDPEARASFVGLRSSHGPGDLLYAVLEGVAFALRQVLEILDRSAGTAARCVRVAGGAARRSCWNEIKAEAWSRPVRAVQEPEAGLVGCAILASPAVGWHSSIEDAQSRMVCLQDALLPREPCSLDARFEAFRSIYPVTKGLTP